ncbi:MAG: methyltransferase domain-containing protein [Dehalococcoidales bacterium]|nr:methyltransferase domain-containing protein [Dehalococcoidales bacterium]
MFWEKEIDDLKDKWNRSSADYQYVFEEGISEYSKQLVSFLLDNRMLLPGCRIIDLGCGVGKYGTYFAKLGCDVTLLDVSDKMLKFASENMSPFKTPWRIYEADFCALTGKESIFDGGFELSTSMMSSAVCDIDTIKKMSGMTHGWAFVTRFYDWKQPFRDLITQETGVVSNVFDDLKGDCETFFNSVKEAGFEPDIRYVDYDWADERTPLQMTDYFLRNCCEEESNDELVRAKVMDAVKKHCNNDGKVIDDIQSKVAWIYWNTEK